MNRVREGHARWRNPFSGVQYTVSLKPEDVSAIVFWSKNYAPLIPHLDELDRAGWGMVFHFTITGLPRPFEPLVPDAGEAVQCARSLAERYGPDAVLWRYDPVLISSVTSPEYHLSRFAELCRAMEGATRTCFFSFAVFYGKVLRNTQALEAEAQIVCYDLPRDDRVELALGMADIAAEHGIEMLSCCGDYLVGGRIRKAHCVDPELLTRLFADRIGQVRARPTREECGCFESTDIGAYDTCPHGCVYCYANTGKAAAVANHARHDAERDSLTG